MLFKINAEVLLQGCFQQEDSAAQDVLVTDACVGHTPLSLTLTTHRKNLTRADHTLDGVEGHKHSEGQDKQDPPEQTRTQWSVWMSSRGERGQDRRTDHGARLGLAVWSRANQMDRWGGVATWLTCGRAAGTGITGGGGGRGSIDGATDTRGAASSG